MKISYTINIVYKTKKKVVFTGVQQYEWTPSGEFFFIRFFPILLPATKKDPKGYFSTKKWIRTDEIKSIDAVENNEFDNEQERTKAIANGSIK